MTLQVRHRPKTRSAVSVWWRRVLAYGMRLRRNLPWQHVQQRQKGFTVQTAKQIHAAIKANVAAFYADEITWDAFNKRNIKLWHEAHRSPRIQAAVLKLWRAECPA
jgi:hypothetical protein